MRTSARVKSTISSARRSTWASTRCSSGVTRRPMECRAADVAARTPRRIASATTSAAAKPSVSGVGWLGVRQLAGTRQTACRRRTGCAPGGSPAPDRRGRASPGVARRPRRAWPSWRSRPMVVLVPANGRQRSASRARLGDGLTGPPVEDRSDRIHRDQRRHQRAIRERSSRRADARLDGSSRPAELGHRGAGARADAALEQLVARPPGRPRSRRRRRVGCLSGRGPRSNSAAAGTIGTGPAWVVKPTPRSSR